MHFNLAWLRALLPILGQPIFIGGEASMGCLTPLWCRIPASCNSTHVGAKECKIGIEKKNQSKAKRDKKLCQSLLCSLEFLVAYLPYRD